MEYLPVDDDATESAPHGDPADSGRSDDGSWLDRAEAALADVERALQRLDDGTYGSCEACGGLVPASALDADPTTRFCADHLPLRLS